MPMGGERRDLTNPLKEDNFGTMKEIVEVAFQKAKPGEIVLLSPACASFDLFKDYKERGEQFKKYAQALQK